MIILTLKRLGQRQFDHNYRFLKNVSSKDRVFEKCVSQRKRETVFFCDF